MSESFYVETCEQTKHIIHMSQEIGRRYGFDRITKVLYEVCFPNGESILSLRKAKKAKKRKWILDLRGAVCRLAPGRNHVTIIVTIEIRDGRCVQEHYDRFIDRPTVEEMLTRGNV